MKGVTVRLDTPRDGHSPITFAEAGVGIDLLNK
jgi:hypothetical protein